MFPQGTVKLWANTSAAENLRRIKILLSSLFSHFFCSSCRASFFLFISSLFVRLPNVEIISSSVVIFDAVHPIFSHPVHLKRESRGPVYSRLCILACEQCSHASGLARAHITRGRCVFCSHLSSPRVFVVNVRLSSSYIKYTHTNTQALVRTVETSSKSLNHASQPRLYNLAPCATLCIESPPTWQQTKTKTIYKFVCRTLIKVSMNN